MLASTEAFSGFAVPDIAAAERFYREVLGIDTAWVMEGMLLTLRLHDGARPTLVYEKSDARPANFTILNFPVDDIEAAVDELASRGVTFERYDAFDHDERGISGGGSTSPPTPRIAWFTDPGGNILAVLEEPGEA